MIGTAAEATRPSDRLPAVDDALERYFAERCAAADAHGPEYRWLWEAAAEASRGGKRIRPRLVLIAHRALGGARDHEAVRVAAAFELLHTALVVHDDVIDRDLVRRGRPNVAGRFALLALGRDQPPARAAAYGEASAILAGDLLLAGAHRFIAELEPRELRTRLLEVFDDGVFRAAAGEHDDVRFAAGGNPTHDEIVAMLENKTAAYSFAAPLLAGAALAGAEPARAAPLAAVGRRLGLAFQLRDDLLGVFGDRAETGKSDLGDLREGKETLLVAYARGTEAWLAVAHRFGRDDLDDGDAAALRAALETSGARRRVERLIDEQLAAAGAGIRAAGLPPAETAELERLAAEGRDRTR